MNRFGIIAICLLPVLIGAAGPSPLRANDVTDAGGMWAPFSDDLFDLLAERSPLYGRLDGGPGASMLILHHPGTDPLPEFTVDGIPVGVGHRWCDDPGLLPLAGLFLDGIDLMGSRFGGSAAAVSLRTASPDTAAATTNARFFKGDHESFLRRLGFATQDAPLGVRVDFDERGDRHAWDFGVPGDSRDFGTPYQPFDPDGLVYKGETSRRALRAALRRNLPDGRSIGLAYHKTRQHKTGLPVLDQKHQEFWADRMTLDWRSPLAGGDLWSAVYINAVDMERDWRRKLEVVRQGALMSYRPDAGGLRVDLGLSIWRLDDNGDDMFWAGADAGPVHGSGQGADLAVRGDWRFAGVEMAPALGVGWRRQAGLQPNISLEIPRLPGPDGLSARVRMDGRAPRADELLTVESVSTPATRYLLLPNEDLGWERRTAAELAWRGGAMGFGLEMAASVSRLREGIGWAADPSVATSGRWENGLDLDARTATLTLTRSGRLAGRYSLLARLALRGSDLSGGAALGLAPDRTAFLRMLWQRPVFKGDGVLELGYVLDHAASMPDPFIPGGGAQLPAVTFHNALLGFRLLGADLGLELRNIANQRFQLSSGALSNGFEKRWRLHWTFRN